MATVPSAPGPLPRLLADDEPEPVELVRVGGRSPLLLVCDHAGRTIPRSLGQLGLPEAELERHIAWDIGIRGVALRLSQTLDASLVAQRYSRLVIDCNRPPRVDNAIPVVSEATEVPGNIGLADAERRMRIGEVFAPYHAAIEAAIDARAADGRETVLIALHSFTPVYRGDARPWHVGTLYGRDGRLAAALHPLLAADAALVVGDNEPYAVTTETDHTIPVHGEARGLLHVGIEIRQDLISDEDGQTEWASRLAAALPRALEEARAANGQP